jgi:hypothetical protein
MKKAHWIWLLLIGVAMLTTFSASSTWAKDCGDNTPPGTDTPCDCGDTVASDTVLDSSDPVLKGGCFPVGLLVAGGVKLDAHLLNPPDPGLCDSSLGFTTGIEILGNNVKILRGIIRGCGTGILGFLSGNTIERVTASGGMTGFFIFGNNHTLSNNLCHDNVFQGIVVIGNGNLLQRNYCARNGQGEEGDGITVRGISNTLNTNRAHNNGRHGIFVQEIFVPGPNFSNGHNFASGNGTPPECLIDDNSGNYC